MPTFFVNVNHFEKVQFCPNTLTATNTFKCHHQDSLSLAGPVWQYCHYILHVEWHIFEENVQNVQAVWWICLDVIIWACRALPIYFAGWYSCFENWNWIFYDTFLIFQFLQALWSICCDIIMILCNYDNPDLLRLALLPVPTFFTIFFTTFILEGVQKVWNQEVDYFFHIFTGSIFSQYFHLFFHRINLVSQLSYVDTLPKI